MFQFEVIINLCRTKMVCVTTNVCIFFSFTAHMKGCLVRFGLHQSREEHGIPYL
jgi:hypothetical protein